MRANYKRLGDYIQQVDVRNINSLYTAEQLVGLSMTKEFRKSTSNIVGVDLSKYKIVSKKQFACDFMSVIRVYKLPVVLNLSSAVIVSPAYTVFEVKDENQLLSEYLMLWLRRSEFDRFAFFKCDSAVRGGFDWEELCNTPIIVPSITEQQKIVNNYNVITRRIDILQKINEKLEKTVQCLFDEMFPGIIDNGNNCFGDIIDFSNGKSRPNEIGLIPVYGGNGIMSYTNKTNAENCIAIGRVGAYCGNTYLCKTNCWISDNAIKAKFKFSEKQFFAYYLLKKSNLFERHIGTGQQLLTQGILSSISLKLPDKEKLNTFNELCESLEQSIDFTKNEIAKLQYLKQMIISRISGK